jgi:hypothetical protein
MNVHDWEWIAAVFRDWEMLEANAYDAVLAEGAGHSGTSAVIDVVARRPG